MTKLQLDFESVFEELKAAHLKPHILRKPALQAKAESICVDTRKITEHTIFCAIKGGNTDTHTLVAKLSGPCALILVEAGFRHSADFFANVNPDFNRSGIIEVTSTRAAWAQLASCFAGHPTRSLKMVAVTGTNGKTSTVWMLRSILEGLGYKAGSIGTLGFIDNQTKEESAHTTPDPDVLYPKLKAWLESGISHVIMEVSSHSLVQGKVHPIQFSHAVFTSFSQDHLDFHSSMGEYLQAKLRLFSNLLTPNAFALFHKAVFDLPAVQATIKNALLHAASYAKTGENTVDFPIESKSFYSLGMAKVAVSEKSREQPAGFSIPIVGDVFSENFGAAVIIASKIAQISISELSMRLLKWRVPPVPGRLEIVDAHLKPWRPLVYVDYAHTPDALEKAILNLSAQPNSVTTVFGCGGDRDKTKRPLMGNIAQKLSKQVFVTSDNPRTEVPEKICEEILVGMSANNKSVHKVVDRKDAIASAVSRTSGKDLILVAGKGHEDYQIIGQQKLHFSDQEVAKECLSQSKTWLVFGAGMSGFAASNHLVHYGDCVYIADDKDVSQEKLAEGVVIVSQTLIPWQKISTVVVSPGVPLTHDVIVKAKKLGLEVITEIDLGFNNYLGSIIAVTGTNGKSTTVAMTEFLLKKLEHPAVACGNIGLPPAALNLREESSKHVSIVELSSYQLEGCRPCPAIAAAITSFSFDHIARHKTMAAYFDAKWNITHWLDSSGIFVVSLDVAKYAISVHAVWPSCKVVVLGQGDESKLVEGLRHSFPHSDFKYLDFDRYAESAAKDSFFATMASVHFDLLNIRGVHNQMNAVSAAMLAQRFDGRSLHDLLSMLGGYRPLPYRCEIIFDDRRRCIVNDSKSTNLESTIAALSIAKRPAILLMGGQGKGEPYHDLLQYKHKISHLLCFGASGQEIASGAVGLTKIDVFSKMQEAVHKALEISKAEQCDIVFSPGCASFDEFKNFEHRGKIFNELVEAFHS